MEPVIFNIQHFSYGDGPGIRTTVFFKGCPLSCEWCHNPEGRSFSPELSFSESKCLFCGKCQSVCEGNVHIFTGKTHTLKRENCRFCGKCERVCPAGAIALIAKKTTVKEILDEIKKDAVFYGSDGGVTISGGEPFAQPEALILLLSALKKENVNVCVETSGFAPANALGEAVPYIDRVLLDCKETNPESLKKHVGMDYTRFLSALDVFEETKTPVVLRLPVIPKINDREDHFVKVAALIEKYSCIESAEVEPYHPLGLSKAERIGKSQVYANPEFLSKDSAEKFAEIIRKHTSKPVTVN